MWFIVSVVVYLLQHQEAGALSVDTHIPSTKVNSEKPT